MIKKILISEIIISSCLFTTIAFGQTPSAPPTEAASPTAQNLSSNTELKKVIATTEGDWPGVTVDITELKRSSGDTLTLKFTIINGSTDELDFGYNFAESGKNDFANIGGTHLLEPKQKKKYLVVRDAQGKCTCSSGLKTIAAGAKLNLWAKFPAPPAEVSHITVAIPHFIPADDVPIS